MATFNYEKSVSFEELYKAYKKCIRGISWKDSVKEFKSNVVSNLVKLHNDLVYGKYNVSPYIRFILKTHKKDRIIYSTHLRDRIVQRALYDNGLYDIISSKFIYDNCACIKDKGTKHAESRFHKFVVQQYNKYGYDCYCLNVDIHNYFGSIPHGLLKKTCANVIKDKSLLDHVNMVIDSFGDILQRSDDDISKDGFGIRGLGLGSQFSQLLALLYLNNLDHYMKEKVGVKFYIRYMDDIVIIHNDKNFLKMCLDIISEKLESLGLEMNPNKTVISHFSSGVEFLKTRYNFSSSGVNKRTKRKNIELEIRRITKLVAKFKENNLTYDNLIQHFNSWCGMIGWKVSKKQMKIVNTYVKSQFIRSIQHDKDNFRNEKAEGNTGTNFIV